MPTQWVLGCRWMPARDWSRDEHPTCNLTLRRIAFLRVASSRPRDARYLLELADRLTLQSELGAEKQRERGEVMDGALAHVLDAGENTRFAFRSIVLGPRGYLGATRIDRL